MAGVSKDAGRRDGASWCEMRFALLIMRGPMTQQDQAEPFSFLLHSL